MSNMVPREIDRFISEHKLPGKVGIVGVTGPAANRSPYGNPGNPRTPMTWSHGAPVRTLRASPSRWAAGVGRMARRIYESIRRERAKRHTYRVLAGMNQAMLWDIGIGPKANIPSVVEAVYSRSEHRDREPQATRRVAEVSRQEAANELRQEAVA